MRKYDNYQNKYHNNIFNFHVSKANTDNCLIMDIDLYMSSFDSKQQIFIDHKKSSDKLEKHTCRTLNILASASYKGSYIKESHAYVVVGDMPEKSFHDNAKFSRLKVYEIVNDRFVISKHLEDFIKDEFYINTIVEFDIFFNIEKKAIIRNKVKYYNEVQAEIQF